MFIKNIVHSNKTIIKDYRGCGERELLKVVHYSLHLREPLVSIHFVKHQSFLFA